jgi:hypothetical protein
MTFDAQAHMQEIEKMLAEQQARFDALHARDQAQKARGEVVGRYITHPYADGHATYEITKVTARTARIRVVTGLGDDWVLPAWGAETSIPLKDAMRFLDQRDRMAELFGRKKEG